MPDAELRGPVGPVALKNADKAHVSHDAFFSPLLLGFDTMERPWSENPPRV